MIEHSVIFVCFTSEEDNLQGWFFAEDDGNQIKKQKHPLLLRQMPVVMSKLQEFKVRSSYYFWPPFFKEKILLLQHLLFTLPVTSVTD